MTGGEQLGGRRLRPLVDGRIQHRRPIAAVPTRGATYMCPVCMSTTAALVAATTSGAGVLGFVAVRFRWLQRLAVCIRPASLRRKS